MAGRILVLDDEENYAEMLRDLLREHNYRVDVATRPERAIDQLEDIPYDLVISDYKMPVMDGADFLQRARELYANLPFILVSGLMNTPELVKVANMGVTLVLEKPLDTARFLGAVSQFTTPMTPEEVEQLAREAEGTEDNGESMTYPEEPRYFNATSDYAKRALHDLWMLSQRSTYVFLLEPEGGDAAFAVKDLSSWHGNLDLPVKEYPSLASLLTAGAEDVEYELLQKDQSNVAQVRLSSAEEIPRALAFMEAANWQVANPQRIIFIVQGQLSDPEFERLTNGVGAVIPPLLARASDLAGYFRRYLRLACDRYGKPGCLQLNHAAMFALMQYDWPRNCAEVQEVVNALVETVDDGPLDLEQLPESLSGGSALSASERLGALMNRFQGRILSLELDRSGSELSEFVRLLQIEPSPQSRVELSQLPLLDGQLGKF